MNFLINKSQAQQNQNEETKVVVVEVENYPPGFTGSIKDVFGMWKDKAINLDEIREQQWLRKEK